MLFEEGVFLWIIIVMIIHMRTTIILTGTATRTPIRPVTVRV